MNKIELIGWKAWFIADENLKTMTSNDASFCVLPDTILGILAIHSDGTKARLTGQDYYFIADGLNGQLIGGDIDIRERGTRQHIETRYKNTIIKLGIWTDPGTMRQVSDEMSEAIWPQ